MEGGISSLFSVTNINTFGKYDVNSLKHAVSVCMCMCILYIYIYKMLYKSVCTASRSLKMVMWLCWQFMVSLVIKALVKRPSEILPYVPHWLTKAVIAVIEWVSHVIQYKIKQCRFVLLLAFIVRILWSSFLRVWQFSGLKKKKKFQHNP